MNSFKYLEVDGCMLFIMSDYNGICDSLLP